MKRLFALVYGVILLLNFPLNVNGQIFTFPGNERNVAIDLYVTSFYDDFYKVTLDYWRFDTIRDYEEARANGDSTKGTDTIPEFFLITFASAECGSSYFEFDQGKALDAFGLSIGRPDTILFIILGYEYTGLWYRETEDVEFNDTLDNVVFDNGCISPPEQLPFIQRTRFSHIFDLGLANNGSKCSDWLVYTGFYNDPLLVKTNPVTRDTSFDNVVYDAGSPEFKDHGQVYTEASFNNAIDYFGEYVGSPIFAHPPVIFCKSRGTYAWDQHAEFDTAEVETEDYISYELCEVKVGVRTPASMYEPYTYNKPIDVVEPASPLLNGFDIDSATGVISFSPIADSITMSGSVCIRANRWREVEEGEPHVLMGYTERNAAIIVYPSEQDISTNDISIETDSFIACGSKQFEVRFSNPVQCGSFSSIETYGGNTATDIQIFDSLRNEIHGILSIDLNCDDNGFTEEATIKLRSNEYLRAGKYTVSVRTGNDFNSIADECGNEINPASENAIATFEVLAKPAELGDFFRYSTDGIRLTPDTLPYCNEADWSRGSADFDYYGAEFYWWYNKNGELDTADHVLYQTEDTGYVYLITLDITGCYSDSDTVYINRLEPLEAPQVKCGLNETGEYFEYHWSPIGGATGYQISLNKGADFTVENSGINDTIYQQAVTEILDTFIIRAIDGREVDSLTPCTYGKVGGYGLCSPEIEPVNIVTPSTDLGNNIFKIEYLESYPGSSIQIFNRWGRKVFESDDYQNDFDGNKHAAGTYYYVLNLNKGAEIEEITGYFSIYK